MVLMGGGEHGGLRPVARRTHPRTRARSPSNGRTVGSFRAGREGTLERRLPVRRQVDGAEHLLQLCGEPMLGRLRDLRLSFVAAVRTVPDGLLSLVRALPTVSGRAEGPPLRVL